MGRHYMVYGARRRRQRLLGVAPPLVAVAALVTLILSTIAGRDDSGRRESRPALRMSARAARWVPPPLTPVSVARQPGRVHVVARGSDQSATAGRPVGGPDGAVVRVTGRLGQRLGGNRGQPRAGKPAQPRAGGRRVGP